MLNEVGICANQSKQMLEESIAWVRANHFHDLAARESVRLGLRSNWRLEIVPGVGHDYRRMGEAAAQILYASS